MAASGDTLDQKWPKGTKRKAVMAAVRKLVDGASGEPAVLVRLQEYFKESAATGAEDDDGGDDGEEDDAAEADDAGGNEMVIEFLGADETASFVNPAWTKYLMLYLKTYGGLLKLRRENPSTGFFGNWGILAAAKRLADSHEVRGMGWPQHCLHSYVSALPLSDESYSFYSRDFSRDSLWERRQGAQRLM